MRRRSWRSSSRRRSAFPDVPLSRAPAGPPVAGSVGARGRARVVPECARPWLAAGPPESVGARGACSRRARLRAAMVGARSRPRRSPSFGRPPGPAPKKEPNPRAPVARSPSVRGGRARVVPDYARPWLARGSSPPIPVLRRPPNQHRKKKAGCHGQPHGQPAYTDYKSCGRTVPRPFALQRAMAPFR